MIEVVAPAKINLFLHVGSVRADGLHDLASLFVFADGGDVVGAAPADDLSLDISGPFASELAAFPIETNLVLRAARTLKAAAGIAAGARLVLDKRLPIASGVGGGSSDAAAALIALSRLWRVDIPQTELSAIAFGLGADVPACLARKAVYVGGAGEDVRDAPRLPPFWLCLVNSRVAMPTGPVFRAFDRAHPHPAPPRFPTEPAPALLDDFKAWLAETRNDLEPFAAARAPVVATAREFLAARSGCLLARMSGSGATVFGLFSSAQAAARAAQAAAGLGWWSLSAPALRED